LKKNFADEKIELLGDRNGVYIKSIISTLSNLKNTKQHDLINIRRDVLKSITPYRDSLNLKYFINYIFILIKLIWKKIMKRKGQKTLANRGLVVAFVGIDGSGKSSAIERVNKKISEHFDVQTISLGSGVSGASWYRKLAFKVFGTKAKFKSHVKNRSSKNAVKKYPWYYTLWLMICLYDKKNAVLKGVQAARSGSIVLCDRWLQTEIENFTDSPRINKKSAITYLTKKLYNLEQEVFSLTKVHKPDLIFRFDVSPENSVLRKPNDLTLEQAIHASQKIKDIVWGGVKVISIDANDSIENVDGSLSEAINKVIYCKN
jgi:thymidylate kinase